MESARPLVLLDGLVVDGTETQPVFGTVTVRDGLVAAVDAGTAPVPAEAEVLDMTGLVVLPGFVDIHTHSDVTILSTPDAPSRVRQGITTEVVGNCGLAPTPLTSTVDREAVRAAVSYLDLDRDIAWDWNDLGGYLECLRERGPAVNVAALAGHLPLHVAACGFGEHAASPAQIKAMQSLLDEEFTQGAWGLSTGLVYAPLTTVTEPELTALAEVVAEHGAVFSWHVRDYQDALLPSIDVAIRVARRAGCRTQLSHVNAVGRRNWAKIDEALRRIDAARADGLDVAMDIYPYLHGSAPLSQLLPDWAQNGPATTWRPRLRDPAIRDRVTASWQGRSVGWDEITISWLPAGADQTSVGRTVTSLAEAAGRSGDEVALDLLADHGTAALMVAGGRSPDVLRQVLAHPACVVASDGLSLDPDGPTGAGVPHPRSYGCFPRYLHDYVLADDQDRLAGLAEGVARCTSRPAERVGLDRGILRAGAAADIVVIDPARLRDRATLTDPQQFADGIVHVFVNGDPVVTNGVATGRRPGRVLSPIRRRSEVS